MTKKCTSCKAEKPLEEFHLKVSSRDGRDTRCKSCCLASQKKHRRDLVEHNIWRTAKNRAKRRELDFDLAIDDIVIPERCPILDIPIFVVEGKKWGNNSPSLDRIDNSKGYIKGNVAVISMQANNMKANLDVEDVELLARSMERFIKYLKREL